MKTPFVLITGFLGSGKTTLLKHILKSVDQNLKIAIIQNEFAPGKSDTIELQQEDKDFQLLEINNGSVFCLCLLDTFIDQLDDFLNRYTPDIIFLEATGLADPVSLGQIFQAEDIQNKMFLAGIWTVIDAVNFQKAHRFIQQVKHQIQMADLIIYNKTDLNIISEETQEQIESWNSSANIVYAKNGCFDNIGYYLKEITNRGNHDKLQFKIPDKQDSVPRPDVGSCVIRTQKIITQQRFSTFWENNKDKIIRLKGFLRTGENEFCSVQIIFDQLNITPVDFWQGSTEIIIMGHDISPRGILKELTN